MPGSRSHDRTGRRRTWLHHATSPAGRPGSTHGARMKPKQTPLGAYFQSISSDITAQHSSDYASKLRRAIDAAIAWRPKACIEDVDATWLSEFAAHLRASGQSPSNTYRTTWGVRRVVTQKAPHAFMTTKTHWRRAENILSNEPTGTLGNYYLRVYEPRQSFTSDVRAQNRGAVKKFLAWSGESSLFSKFDFWVLEEFRTAEILRGVSATVARQTAGKIRRIVNDWMPGRIDKRPRWRLPASKPGTVQHFAKTTFLSGKTSKGLPRSNARNLGRVAAVMHALLEYNGGEGLPISKFNEETSTKFLQWCLTQKCEKTGSLLSVNSINTFYRSTLASISREAVKAGLMKRRLALDPIAPLKQRPKRKIAALAVQVPTPAPPQKRRGRKPTWGHLQDWLRERLLALPNATPAELREAYRREHPDGRLPNKDAMRTHISALKRSLAQRA